MGGNAKEALRVMQGYFRMFDMFKTCIETFNYTGCVGNCSQTSNWQTFSATASMQALIHGVIGVEWHRGGICYLPGQYTGEHTLKNFRFRKKVYSFRTEGKGEYAQIYVNGKALAGTLQFPADICKEEKKIDCVIRHSGKAPDRPVLYMAIDLPVSHLKSGREILTFRAAKRCHAPVRMYSPMKPVVTVNDKEIAVEWDEQTKILWFDREFKKGDKVTARIGAIPVNN